MAIDRDGERAAHQVSGNEAGDLGQPGISGAGSAGGYWTDKFQVGGDSNGTGVAYSASDDEVQSWPNPLSGEGNVVATPDQLGHSGSRLDSAWSRVAASLESEPFDTAKVGRWLDQKDSNQCAWMVQYLRSRFPVFFVSAFEPEHEAVLRCFKDVMNNDLQRQKLFDKMRAAWTQKKFRDRRKQKQLQNMLVSKTSMGYLKALSKQFDISVDQVLEEIIYVAANNQLEFKNRARELKAVARERREQELKGPGSVI